MPEILSFNTDSYLPFTTKPVVNTTTGLGVAGVDKSYNAYLNFYLPPNVWNEDLNSRYTRIHWQLNKIVTYYPEQMSKKFGHFKIEEDLDLENEVKKQTLALAKKMRDSQIAANIYGDYMVIIFAEDGLEWDQPVDVERLQSWELSKIGYTYRELNIEFGAELFGDEQYYDPDFYFYWTEPITNKDKTIILESAQKIHKSRILRFKGNELTPQELKYTSGWNDSLITLVYEALLIYKQALGHIGNGLASFEFIVHSVHNFFQKILNSVNNSEKRAKIEAAYQLAFEGLSTEKGFITDSKNEIAIVSRQFRGVADVVEILVKELIAAADIDPGEFYKDKDQIKANSAEEALRRCGKIETKQVLKWSPLIEQLKPFIAKINNADEDNLVWHWASTYVPTDEEKWRVENLKADFVRKLYNNGDGFISREEARSAFDNPDSIINFDDNSFNAQLQEQEEDKLAEREFKQNQMAALNRDAKPFQVQGDLIPQTAYSFTLKDLQDLEEEEDASDE